MDKGGGDMGGPAANNSSDFVSLDMTGRALDAMADSPLGSQVVQVCITRSEPGKNPEGVDALATD